MPYGALRVVPRSVVFIQDIKANYGVAYTYLYMAYMMVISGDRKNCGRSLEEQSAIQTVPNALRDLAFARRVLRGTQKQKIDFKIRLKIWSSGIDFASSIVEVSSIRDNRLLTISKVIDFPS